MFFEFDGLISGASSSMPPDHHLQAEAFQSHCLRSMPMEPSGDVVVEKVELVEVSVPPRASKDGIPRSIHRPRPPSVTGSSTSESVRFVTVGRLG